MRKLIQATALMLILATVAWAAYTKMTHVALINSTIDSTPIGGTTPSTVAATAVSDSALSTGCVGNTSGLLVSNANCLVNINVGVPIFHSLPANVSVSATTQTQIDTVTLPPLPAICGTNGCRVKMSYAYYIFGGNHGFCWASDGTNLYEMSSSDTPETNFSTCQAGATLSPAQFSAGATPTISVFTISGGTVTACTATQGAASPCTTAPTNSPTVNSGMQIEVVQSN